MCTTCVNSVRFVVKSKWKAVGLLQEPPFVKAIGLLQEPPFVKAVGLLQEPPFVKAVGLLQEPPFVSSRARVCASDRGFMENHTILEV